MFIDKFKTGQIAVQFSNHEDGIMCLSYLDKHGLTWASGHKLLEHYKNHNWRGDALAYSSVKKGVIYAQSSIAEKIIDTIIDFSPELIADIEINIDQDEILELLGG